jgi:hypothetical protein
MLGMSTPSVNDSINSFESVSQIIGQRHYRVEPAGASEYRHGSIE